MRSLIAVIFLALVLLSTQALANESPENAQINELTSSFFTHFKADDFDAAAKLFHYPPEYSPEELEKDREGVAMMLAIYAENFGAPGKPVEIENLPKFYHLSVSGGNAQYWSQEFATTPKYFSLDFSIQRDALLLFRVMKLTDTCEIQVAGFGIDVQSPDAQNRMQAIQAKVMEGVQKYIESMQ